MSNSSTAEYGALHSHERFRYACSLPKSAWPILGTQHHSVNPFEIRAAYHTTELLFENRFYPRYLELGATLCAFGEGNVPVVCIDDI